MDPLHTILSTVAIQNDNQSEYNNQLLNQKMFNLFVSDATLTIQTDRKTQVWKSWFNILIEMWQTLWKVSMLLFSQMGKMNL